MNKRVREQDNHGPQERFVQEAGLIMEENTTRSRCSGSCRAVMPWAVCVAIVCEFHFRRHISKRRGLSNRTVGQDTFDDPSQSNIASFFC